MILSLLQGIVESRPISSNRYDPIGSVLLHNHKIKTQNLQWGSPGFMIKGNENPGSISSVVPNIFWGPRDRTRIGPGTGPELELSFPRLYIESRYVQTLLMRNELRVSPLELVDF